MNFDELINQFTQPEIVTVNDVGDSDTDECCNDDIQYYMFFQNLETIKTKIEEILSLNRKDVDNKLKDGHDWAADHVTTSRDDIEEVADFILNELKR